MRTPTADNARVATARAIDLVAGCALTVALALPAQALLAAPPAALVLALAGFAVIASAIAAFVPAHPWPVGIGHANRITLLRAVVVVYLASLLPWPGLAAGHGWSLAALALAALALDGADGWLARRLEDVTGFGARFDMEIDALLILVLGMLAWALDKVGAWVLLIGLMRYGFLAAGMLYAVLRRPLFPSMRRKVVCVVQVGTLLTCLAPPVGPAVASPLALLALALLSASFAVDVHWLLRHSSRQTLTEGAT